MSDNPSPKPPLGWLLLRDNHAVPITGLAPEELKAARRELQTMHETETPGHVTGLNAILKQLGFAGDIGDYRRTHWPRLESFLAQHDMHTPANLFASDPHVFGLNSFVFAQVRQELAERWFFGPIDARPTAIFLGDGIEWDAWSARIFHARIRNLDTPGALPERPEDVLALYRLELIGQWGCFDDKLVAGTVRTVVDKTYFEAGYDPKMVATRRERLRQVIAAFRACFPEDGPGWVDVIPYPENPNLIFLRNRKGEWDVTWREIRVATPPTEGPETTDLPSWLQRPRIAAWRVYFQRDLWFEKVAHEAEQHFYDNGGKVRFHPHSSRVLVADYLGIVPPAQASAVSTPPPGFREATVLGRRLFIGPLVTVGELRTMLTETGWLSRRTGESLHRANPGLMEASSAADRDPAGLTWRDALAVLAWLEEKLGMAVRTLSYEEHRALRPHVPLVENNQNLLPWLHAATAIEWSEPMVDMVAGTWNRPFIPGDRWPPEARWVAPIAYTTYGGVEFIDAWDVGEWIQEGEWRGRHYEDGEIGSESWGEYKVVKVTLRPVIEISGPH